MERDLPAEAVPRSTVEDAIPDSSRSGRSSFPHICHVLQVSPNLSTPADGGHLRRVQLFEKVQQHVGLVCREYWSVNGSGSDGPVYPEHFGKEQPVGYT